MRTSLAYGASVLLLALLASCATYAPQPLPEQNDLADRAQRAAAAVVQAQVFAAGLLADPQISSSADYPVDAGAPLVLAGNYQVIVPALIDLAQRHAR
jgi:hypothetical protein